MDRQCGARSFVDNQDAARLHCLRLFGGQHEGIQRQKPARSQNSETFVVTHH
jgi:hypothetical protein